MGLFDEPEQSSTGSGRWIVAAVGLLLAVGAAVLFVSRSADDAEEPANVTSDRARSTDPTSDPEPDPSPDLEPERSMSAPTEVRAPEPEPEPPPPLAPTPALIVLRVTSDVDDADVFVDREYVGTTPFESAAITPGPHRLIVSAEGYEGFSRDIRISDEVTSVDATFKVVRLDQRVSVIHKHRFGECRGYLAANLDGIHYQSDDDDAFSVAFASIENFTIDYLEHNLRVKVQNGRTYNFTDAETNADRLFVFHREVERARTRLADAGF